MFELVLFSIIRIIIVVAIIVLIVAKCLKIVRESEAFVVERLGKYNKTLSTGVNILIPFIDRVSRRITLKEQVVDFEPQPVITKDNVTMQVDTVVYFKIIDPKLFTYGVNNPILAIENLTATTLRNVMGELELDETLTSRDTINSKLRSILDEATDPWGIKVTRVELKNIMPPKSIQESMEKQMKAERDRRETILEAEGHKQAVITRKEGDKQAIILEAEAKKAAEIAEAEAKAKAIELVNEATANGLKMIIEAAGKDGMLVLKQLESLEKVADGNATKLIVPTSLTESASLLASASEIIKTADANKKVIVPKTPVKDECCE